MRQPFRMPFRRADARGLSANTLTALAAAALATVYSLSFWDRLLGADIPDGDCTASRRSVSATGRALAAAGAVTVRSAAGGWDGCWIGACDLTAEIRSMA